jgi:predicted membrane GTPase involved in stress response
VGVDLGHDQVSFPFVAGQGRAGLAGTAGEQMAAHFSFLYKHLSKEIQASLH